MIGAVNIATGGALSLVQSGAGTTINANSTYSNAFTGGGGLSVVGGANIVTLSGTNSYWAARWSRAAR